MGNGLIVLLVRWLKLEAAAFRPVCVGPHFNGVTTSMDGCHAVHACACIRCNMHR